MTAKNRTIVWLNSEQFLGNLTLLLCRAASLGHLTSLESGFAPGAYSMVDQTDLAKYR